MKDFLIFGYRLLFLSCILTSLMVVSGEPHWSDVWQRLVAMWCDLLFVHVVFRYQHYGFVLFLICVATVGGLVMSIGMLKLYLPLLILFLVLLQRMDLFSQHREYLTNIAFWPGVKYFFYLIPMIFSSCWETAMCIWGFRGKIHPYVVWVNLPDLDSSTNNQLRNLVTAHSVTLTPGTLVLALKKNSILVHGLNAWSWRSLQDMDWHENIRRMFSSNGPTK